MWRIFPVGIALIVLAGCRSEKVVTYVWENEDEHQRLTLRNDKTFILDIDAGYYSRIDTGTFIRKGDTLILNPNKRGNYIDSLVEMDSLFLGHRFLEILEPEITVGDDNLEGESYARAILFPTAIVNDAVLLALIPDDPSYTKLLIPDSLAVTRLLIRVPEHRTCIPELTYTLNLPRRDRDSRSFRVYVRSHDTRDRYLGGFKWLVRGDSIQTSFTDEWCTPSEAILIRRR